MLAPSPRRRLASRRPCGRGYRVGRLGSIRAAGASAPVARQFVYTARTANDAMITLPDVVRNELLQIGLAHQTIAITRVGFTGNVSTSYIDMTPRTGDSSTDPALKVMGRAVPVIDAKISAIEKAINSSAATTGGGRALYAGLTKSDFTGAPVTIISSGIDLANPDDFRSLKWSVPPEEVVAGVKQSDALPNLHGPVTFVIVPTAARSSNSVRPRRTTSRLSGPPCSPLQAQPPSSSSTPTTSLPTRGPRTHQRSRCPPCRSPRSRRYPRRRTG